MKKRATIILIEDNYEMAENIAAILTLAMYNVYSAANGREGIELIKREHPDLILCDIIMPQLDGYGVLHIMNRDPELMNIPFIFLTAKNEQLDVRSGMNLGADDYITKPFNGLDLLKVVEIRLQKNKQIRESKTTENNDINMNGTLDIQSLVIQKHIRTFRKKELIFMEGQSAFDLYYIVSGTVKTYKVNYEGKEIITGFFQAGDYLGYVPLLEDRPHHESAEVREDAEISIIPKHDFLNMIFSVKSVAKKFLKLLSNSVIETEERLLDIAYQSVRQRVAGALIKIYKADPGYKATGIITTSRRDISNLIGTTTESLNRTLADFKEEKLIEIRDDGIKILQLQKLEKNAKATVMGGVKMLV